MTALGLASIQTRATFPARERPMAPRRSAHLAAFDSQLNQRMRSRRSLTKEQFAERGVPKDFGIKQNAKSHQRSRQPGATQARSRSSQGLPRPPFETFPLREGRDDEGKVLGLSRSENAQTHFPLSLDPAPERRRPRAGSHLQPFRRRLEGREHRTRSQDPFRSRHHRRSRVQGNRRAGEDRAREQNESEEGGLGAIRICRASAPLATER